MRISCIIVDDEPYAGNLLEEYVLKIPYLQLEKKCLTALEALGFLQDNSVDLIFLDINMPQLSGMQLARTLPQDQNVIFTTAYTSFAVESYTVNALDYLLKPITFDRFVKAVERAARHVGSSASHLFSQSGAENRNFFIKTGKAMIKVSPTEIYYIEGLKDYVIFRLENEKHIVYKKMRQLEEILVHGFVRIHHSFIVNVNHIRKIEDNHVHILDQRLAIGEKYREGFRAFIKNRLM